MEKFTKIYKLLGDSKKNLEGMNVEGVLNCGRVFVTAQNIDAVIGMVKRIEMESAACSGQTEAAGSEEDDNNADNCDEV